MRTSVKKSFEDLARERGYNLLQDRILTYAHDETRHFWYGYVAGIEFRESAES